MAIVKSSSRFAKKQAPTSGAHAVHPRKASGSKKPCGSAKASPSKSRRKSSSKLAAKYSSLKSRQTAVQNMKSSIWAALQRINDALITHAEMGNLPTAKELFNFAGVYGVPMPEDENAATAAVPSKEPGTEAAEAAPVHPIDLFFKKIGVEASTAEPESEVA